MVSAGLARLLVAYAAGSLCGMLALVLETLPKGDPRLPGALAAYGLAGGLVAGFGRLVLGWIVSPRAARVGVLVVIGAFLSLHLLYFLNVRLLPGEPYSTFKSIAFDLVLLALTATPLIWASRSPWAQETRYRFGREALALGAALLTIQSGWVILEWPSAPREPSGRGRGTNLLLVVLDSVRRDHVGFHGYGRPTSPSMDMLARQGRVYEAAYSASSWTVPSVARLLRAPVGAANAGESSVAGRLAAQGYVTACFTDNPHMYLGSPLLGGFDRVERSVGNWRWMFRKTMLGEVIERLDGGNDHRLVDRAVEWMSGRHRPFFLYVHLMDSHTPYDHPPIDGRRRRGRRIEFPYSGMAITSAEAESIVARYDGGIRSADGQVGRLLAAAAQNGQPFLAVITADHGESLGESGRWFHGGSLAPELLAVPLVVVGEGVTFGRVSGPVSSVSISRTLLAAAGIPCEGCQGSDLRTSAGDGFAEGGLPPDLLYRIGAGYKLVLDQRTGQRRLFDLRNDPGEDRDIHQARPKLAVALEKGLAGPEVDAPPAPDDLERLRSVGYVGY